MSGYTWDLMRAAAPGMLKRVSRAIRIVWVSVQERKLRQYIGETLLFTIYTHCGN